MKDNVHIYMNFAKTAANFEKNRQYEQATTMWYKAMQYADSITNERWALKRHIYCASKVV